MSSTRDWMRSSEDQERDVRAGLPLGGVILWISSLIVVVYGALALQHLFS